MELNNRIRWAAIWGLCFLISIVIQQSVTRTIGILNPVYGFEWYLRVFIYAAAVIAFFLTFILHIRGYLRLGEKYQIPALRLTPYILMYAATLMCVGAILNVVTTSTGVGLDFTNVFVGFVSLFYILGFGSVGLTVFRLRNTIGSTALGSALLGVIIFIYGTLQDIAILLGITMPHFLGSFVWIPVPEALFAIAGTILFFAVTTRTDF